MRRCARPVRAKIALTPAADSRLESAMTSSSGAPFGPRGVSRRASLVLLAGAGLAACGRAQTPPQTALDGRIEDWTREIFAESPELATRAGVGEDIAGRGFAARLDDRSGDAADRARGAALRRLVELRGLDLSRLAAPQRLSVEVLSAQFAAAADGAAFAYGRFDQLGGVSPYAFNQMEGAFLDLPDFFDARHVVRTIDDAETYLARLRLVAAAIDAETGRMRADAAAGVIPPGFILDRTAEALDRASGDAPGATLYVASLRAKLAALPQTDARAVQRGQALLAEAEALVRDRIYPAQLRAAALTRGLRARASDDPGVWRLPDGEAYYRAALKIETTTDLTADDIHRIGLDRVAQMGQALDIALRQIGLADGPVGARLAAMTADPRYRYPESPEGREQLLADTRARIAQVMQLAPRWFAHLPRAPLDVRRTPLVSEPFSSGAYYEGPALNGVSPGIYYLNLRNLAELTRIDLPTQDYHEAVPGHHFQIALAREHTDLPLLRRLLGFDSYSEGWALYAEQLVDEQGLYEQDPIGRIGFLRWQLWRAARLVVDTGVHAKRWARAQAIDYLTQTTGDTPGVIISEVERYTVSPGQACAYELGRREIVAARDDARDRLGPHFDLRGFHDAVLSEAEIPLPVLRARVRAWTDARLEN